MTQPDDSSAFLPPQIQNRKFTVVRRGYDRTEVDEFLKQVSTMMSELLREQASALAVSVVGEGDISEAEASEQMAAMEDIEARAARRLNAASLEADRLRTEARRMLEKTNREVQEIESAAKAKANQITSEAEQAKQRIMGDLMRRRKEAQAHVEMLRAARDELLASFSQVQRITAQAMEPLDSALERAKTAADNAVQQFRQRQQETQETVEELGAEVAHGPSSEGSQDRSQDIGAKAGEGAVVGDATDVRARAAVDVGVATETAQETAAAKSPKVGAVESPQELEDVTVEPVSQDTSKQPSADLSSIFARLREKESVGETETPTSETTTTDEAATEPEPKSAKSRSKKAPTEEIPVEPVVTEVPSGEVLAGETSSGEAPPGGATPVESSSAESTPPTPDADLERQLKRALTHDESRVLRAIHKFHGKSSKVKSLQKAILSEVPRRASFRESLGSEVSHDMLTRVLLTPLIEELDSCDLQNTDSKALVQQVRDIYRRFSQDEISVVVSQLASADVSVESA